MANEDLGIKRDCPNCGARFYDLKRDPALCPKCEHEFVPEVILKPRRVRPDEPTAKPPRPTEDSDDEELENDEELASLDEADDGVAPAVSARKSALDDDDEEEDEDEEDIDVIDDIDVNIDDDDSTLLDDEDDEDDLGGVITGGDGNEDER